MPDPVIGHEFARIQGLRVTGTAGVLLKAKEGHISEVKPLLDKLISQGFRLADEVKNRILILAEE